MVLYLTLAGFSGIFVGLNCVELRVKVNVSIGEVEVEVAGVGIRDMAKDTEDIIGEVEADFDDLWQ